MGAQRGSANVCTKLWGIGLQPACTVTVSSTRSQLAGHTHTAPVCVGWMGCDNGNQEISRIRRIVIALSKHGFIPIQNNISVHRVNQEQHLDE